MVRSIAGAYDSRHPMNEMGSEESKGAANPATPPRLDATGGLAGGDPAAAPPSGSGGGLRFMARALRYRNYRLFFVGQGVSLIGTWLSRIATAWLVYRLVPADQPQRAVWLLGVLGFASMAPVFVLTPFTGVLVDRWSRHKILLATQVAAALQSAALAILTLGHWITIPQVMMLSVIQGLINAFDGPARQAFVIQLVDDRNDLPNAIALNSSMFNGARLIGPAVGGVLIALIGEGWCFAIDAVSYVAIVASLLAMNVAPHVRPADVKHVLLELKEGIQYAAGFAPIRVLLMTVGSISLMAMSFQTLMPAFANELAAKGHGAQVLGYLMSAVGVGSLAGAVYLASRKGVLGLGRGMAMAAGLLSAGLIGFSFMPPLGASMAVLAVCGFGMIVTLASGNTILQTIIEDRMRGRVMSFFMMAVMGMAPFGSLLAGFLASRLGEATAVRLAGVCCGAAAILFSLQLPRLRKLVMPIYASKGIVPEISTGLRSASTFGAPTNG